MNQSTLDAAFTFASHDDWPRVVSAARDALASDPDEPSAHALLALGLAHLGQSREAVEAGRRAVARDPEMAFAHYAHAWALLEYDDSIRAERAAREALRLQPGADEYGLLANVYSRQLRWKEALDAAESGLDEDPLNECCRNFRALALTSLGRTGEATSAVHQSLAADPDDAYSHANRGWLLLRVSNTEEALDSFLTALRLDPAMEWARLGVIEAMKARNRVYRLMLRYTLWRGSASTGSVSILIRFASASATASAERSNADHTAPRSRSLNWMLQRSMQMAVERQRQRTQQRRSSSEQQAARRRGNARRSTGDDSKNWLDVC